MISQHNKIATKVIQQWVKSRRSAIVIAPPLTEPEKFFFNILEDPAEHERILGEAATTLAIAKLSGSDFKSEKQFVERLAQEWQISYDRGEDAVFVLEELTQNIVRQGKKPIIIVRRFHEAIERLGEDFGTKLRNLDHNYNLITVVEIPVSLQRLRDEWKSCPGNAPFLNSDFGQFHSEYLLQGYLREEIFALVCKRDDREEMANFIFSMTGGLPPLVNWLIDEIESKPVAAVHHIVRAHSTALCGRLVGRMDVPGQKIFKMLAARNLYEPAPLEGESSLRDHPWSKLIIREDGNPGCRMLNFACLENLTGAQSFALLQRIMSGRSDGRLQRALLLLNDYVCFAPGQSEIWVTLRLLANFDEAANPFGKDWNKAKTILRELERVTSSSTDPMLSDIRSLHDAWKPIVELAADFCAKKDKDIQARLEPFVFLTSPSRAPSLLRLLHFRLLRSQRYASEPLAALKLIVELPECLVQIYSERQLGFNFWKFKGLEISDTTVLERLKRPYKIPAKGSVLGFSEILHLCVLLSDDVPSDKRLFGDISDISKWLATYDERKEQVHSASFSSMGDWLKYQGDCLDLSRKVWATFADEDEVIELPDVEQAFLRILQQATVGSQSACV